MFLFPTTGKFVGRSGRSRTATSRARLLRHRRIARGRRRGSAVAAYQRVCRQIIFSFFLFFFNETRETNTAAPRSNRPTGVAIKFDTHGPLTVAQDVVPVGPPNNGCLDLFDFFNMFYCVCVCVCVCVGTEKWPIRPSGSAVWSCWRCPLGWPRDCGATSTATFATSSWPTCNSKCNEILT